MEYESTLRISEKELSDLGIGVSDIQDKLTLPNPAYTNSVRFGRGKFKRPPSHICYLQKEGDEYILPRQFFGLDTKSIVPVSSRKVSLGRPLHSESRIKLWDFQQSFIDSNLEIINSETDLLLEAPCGHGKCHGKGTKILMFDGSVKLVEEIKVGDLLMGDDSTPRRVLSLARGVEELFEVKQTKGETYIVNRSHVLSLQKREWGKTHKGDKKDIDLTDYLKLSKTQKSYLYGYCVPVEYPEVSLRIPPYFLGVWLGDGTSKEISITTAIKDKPLVKYYEEVASLYGLRVNILRQRGNASNLYRFVSPKFVGEQRVNVLLNIFRDYDLIENKHIPSEFLVNSRENRLQLLAGLIDSDGSYSNKLLEITQKREGLACQIRQLCWSLGFRVKMTRKIVNGETYWRLCISGNIHEVPVKLDRKKPVLRAINKDPFVTGIRVNSIGDGEYYGFTLDGNHRYCLWDGTVTHNTILGIWMAYKRGVQTMVLVPTYFLAKQWLSKISEFTDDATVFIVDSSSKEIPLYSDFTIVVLDLFSARVLPKVLMKTVGHIILDEAHRVGAETYLPILEEIPSKYRTALTATFRRADKVHLILKYHFGQVLKMENILPKPLIYGIRTGVKVENVVSKSKPHEHFLKFLEEEKGLFIILAM